MAFSPLGTEHFLSRQQVCGTEVTSPRTLSTSKLNLKPTHFLYLFMMC